MIKHKVSGEVRELTGPEFLALFDTEVHEAIRRNAAKPGVEAVVCMENLDMCSSQFGARTAMIVGPGCTYQLSQIETLPNFRLGDVPSRFQYPTAYWPITKKEPQP
jgi:hypothetical protein